MTIRYLVLNILLMGLITTIIAGCVTHCIDQNIIQHKWSRLRKQTGSTGSPNQIAVVIVK